MNQMKTVKYNIYCVGDESQECLGAMQNVPLF